MIFRFGFTGATKRRFLSQLCNRSEDQGLQQLTICFRLVVGCLLLMNFIVMQTETHGARPLKACRLSLRLLSQQRMTALGIQTMQLVTRPQAPAACAADPLRLGKAADVEDDASSRQPPRAVFVAPAGRGGAR